MHNNLVDRIEETNQQQLDDLQAQVDRGELDPKPSEICVDVSRVGCRCAAHRLARPG